MLLGIILSCRPCGEEIPCSVGMGNYYSVRSFQEIEKIWIFFHGWSGSPQQYLGKSIIEEVHAHNVLLILPEGVSNTWSVQNMGGEDSHREESAFLQQILLDVEQQYGTRNLPIFLGGFSLGASLSETLACDGALDVAGIYPISGGFWDPVPMECSEPSFAVRHVHGLQDTTWPYEGRYVGTGHQAHQETVQALWKSEYGCSEETIEQEEESMSCVSWKGCSAPVSWCFHNEGHTRIKGWFSAMMDFSLSP